MRVLQRAAVSLSPFHTTYAGVTKQRLGAGTFNVVTQRSSCGVERCVTPQKTAVLRTPSRKV